MDASTKAKDLRDTDDGNPITKVHCTRRWYVFCNSLVRVLVIFTKEDHGFSNCSDPAIHSLGMHARLSRHL